MIGDPLGYPLRNDRGRAALLGSAAAIVAVAVGVRYAGALAPSVFAVAPATLAVVGAVVLLGTAVHVLVPDDAGAAPTVLAILTAGVRALVISVVVVLPPTGLLVLTLAGLPGADALEAGAGPFLLVASTTSLLFFLACAYAYPAFVAASASAGSIRAVFDPAAVAPALSDARYFLRWTVGCSLVGVGAGFAAVTVGGAGATGLLAAGVAAYLLVAGSRAVGEGYALASGGAS